MDRSLIFYFKEKTMSQDLVKQNFGAAMLYIGAVLDGLNFKYEFWDKNTAAFDGITFYFPKLPLEVSDKALDYIWGFVYHELGHAIYTDFGALKEACKIGGLVEGVYRVFEDVWQEGMYLNDTPYSFKRLSRLTEVLAQDNLLGKTDTNMSPLSSLRNFLLNYGYGAVLKHSPVNEFSISDEKILVQQFNQAVVDRVKALTLSLPLCETSYDVLDISKLVVKAFEEEKPQDQEQSQPNDQSDKNDNQGSDSNSQGQSSESSQSKDSDSKESSESSSSQDSPTQSDSTQPSSSQSEEGKVKEAFEQVLNATTSDFKDVDRGDMLQGALSDSIKESGEPLPYNRPNSSRTESKPYEDSEFISQGERAAGGLIPRFKRLFESQTKTRKTRKTRGRKLGRNIAIRMMTNDPRIFVKKDYQTGVDTHISVVLDDSGSMISNDKLDVSLKAISAIGLAAEQTRGVTFSACSFPGLYDSDSVEVICTEKERFRSITSRFLRITGSGCSTPMSNGVIWAMEQCARSDKPRKIIIVITDGSPNSGHQTFMHEMVDMCKKNNVEIWGIGIKLEGVKKYFDTNMVINDVSELPNALLNQITNSI
jgi:cobaltochelatase CobT